MGFYYLSIFSLILIATIYAAAIGGFWFFWVRLLRRKFRGPEVWLVLTAIAVAPWAEELWIAYHFGQACKEAGTFVYKKVQVEGFYDDTHGWRADKLRASGYQFVEGRDNSSGRDLYWRHERSDGQIRSVKIDRPTARYHYQWPQRNLAVGHKMYKQSEEIRDVQTGEVLGRSTEFGRTSPWFFVALDDPGMSCPSPGKKGGVLLYRQVLEPASNRKGE